MNHPQHTLSLNDWRNVSIALPAGMEDYVVNYGTTETIIRLSSTQNDKRTITRSDNISEG